MIDDKSDSVIYCKNNKKDDKNKGNNNLKNTEILDLDAEKLKDRKRTESIVLRASACNNFRTGIGMNYIVPFGLAMGANNIQIGLLSSLPNLLGNSAQLFTPKAMENNSRKKLAMIGAFTESFMWLMIILTGIMFFTFKQSYAVNFLIIVYSALFIFSIYYAPAWSSLLKDIIIDHRGDFFAKRDRIRAFSRLLALLIAALILDYFKQYDILMGFAVLFLIAGISCFITGLSYRKVHEPKLELTKGYYFTFWQFIKNIPKSNFGKFSIFITLVHFAMYLSFPFFTVYMLKNLGFSYIQWVLIVIMGIISSLIFLPFWGHFVDTYGNLRAVRITAFLLPIVPLLWISSTIVAKNNPHLLFPYLMIVQVFSDMILSGFNLSFANFIYDAVTPQRMALCIAYNNTLVNFGIFFGAAIGGIIAAFNFKIFGMPPILLAFLISAMLGLIIYGIIAPMIKEVRDVHKFGIDEAKEELLAFTHLK